MNIVIAMIVVVMVMALLLYAVLKIYQKSGLLTTKQVAEYGEWNTQSIETRQKWLAKHAAAVWHL